MSIGWFKKGLLAVILILLFLIFFYFLTHSIKLNDVKDYVSSFGVFIPLVIFFMIVAASSIGFIFQIPVAVAALLLGTIPALILSVLGLTFGAAISFYIVRYLGRDHVEAHFVHKSQKVQDYNNILRKNGFVTIFILRLITIIPYELINIAGGLSRISFKKFFLATLVGIIPGTLVAVYFAKNLDNVFSLQFLYALIINVCFSLLPLLSKGVRRIVFGLPNKVFK